MKKIKLILVGSGAVGKTSIANRLISNQFKEQSRTTEGIEITAWENYSLDNTDVKINIWDFGGQEIYYPTHQLFLTDNSLYLFIWEARSGYNLIDFDYWLNLLKSLTKNSPIIVVQNKIDERSLNIDQNFLKTKFPNIVSFHNVSAKTNKGIDQLREKISLTCMEIAKELPIISEEWDNIIKIIKNLDENYITLLDFLKVSNESLLDTEESRNLLRFMHDSGDILYFEDNQLLKEYIFLKIDWVLESIYSLLDSPIVAQAHGNLDYDQLDSIYPNKKSSEKRIVIELLKKFELILHLNWNNSFLIPSLLSSARPNNSNPNKDSIRLEYHYDFLESGIVPRLIVRLNDLLDRNIYWKNGAKFNLNNSEALVEQDQIKRRIIINSYGPFKVELLSIIQREIDEINGNFKNESVKKMIPCICGECKESDNPFFYNAKYLSKLIDKKVDYVECQKSLKSISIADLLQKIDRKSLQKLEKLKSDNNRIKILTTSFGAIAVLASILALSNWVTLTNELWRYLLPILAMLTGIISLFISKTSK